MAEIWELVKLKVMYGLYVCLIAVVVVLLVAAVWHMAVYYLTRSRIESAKQIYQAIRLGEPMEKAVMLFRSYRGGKDQYAEEALLTNGMHEITLCLQFGFFRGESGEIRLTYVDDRLVQKQQNGIW